MKRFIATILTIAPLCATAQPDQHTASETPMAILMEKVPENPQFVTLWDVEGSANYFAQKLSELLYVLATTLPEAQIPPVNLVPIADALGFTSVDGMMASSVELRDGFYRSDIFLLTPRGLQGLLKLNGSENKPFSLGDFAPADSLIAMETQLDLQQLIPIAEGIATAVMGPMGQQILEQQLAQPVPGAQVTFGELIGSIGNRMIGFLRLSEDGSSLEYLIQLDDTGKVLYELKELLQQDESVQIMKTGDMLVVQTDIEAIPDFSITFVAKSDGRLYITSSLECLKQFEAGTIGPRLGSKQGYSSVVEKLPQEGLVLSYNSKDYFKFWRDRALADIPQDDPSRPFLSAMLNIYFGRFDNDQVGVVFLTEDGIQSINYADTSIQDAIAIAAIAIPAGMASAMAIPAFQQVQKTSQEKTVLNNLRRISNAADQYFIESGEEVVTVKQLMRVGLLENLDPIAGESYIILAPIHRDADSVEVYVPALDRTVRFERRSR